MGGREARTRLGFLVPARNVTCEYEYVRAVPEGVSCHFSRLARANSELTADSIIEMMSVAGQASALLTGTGAAVIAAACTAGSFLDGRDAGQVLAAQVSEAAGGVPAFTTTQAVEELLTSLGARSIFMLTPYPVEITDAERVYFEGRGFAFSGTDTFACRRSEDIRAISATEVRDRLLSNRGAIEGSDAVFVSCTNLATMDRLAEISVALDRPAISSNSATIWKALQVAGLSEAAGSIAGLGGSARLFPSL